MKVPGAFSCAAAAVRLAAAGLLLAVACGNALAGLDGPDPRGPSRLLKNVGEAADARQKWPRKRSLPVVNEHFEAIFNAADATQVVFQQPASDWQPSCAPNALPDSAHCIARPQAAPWGERSSATAPARSSAAPSPFPPLAADHDRGIDLADHDSRSKGQQRGKGQQGKGKQDNPDWERLSPKQREKLEARRHHFEDLSPQQQRRLLDARERFQRLPPEERARLRERWRELPPEERRRWRESASDNDR